MEATVAPDTQHKGDYSAVSTTTQILDRSNSYFRLFPVLHFCLRVQICYTNRFNTSKPSYQMSELMRDAPTYDVYVPYA